MLGTSSRPTSSFESVQTEYGERSFDCGYTNATSSTVVQCVRAYFSQRERVPFSCFWQIFRAKEILSLFCWANKCQFSHQRGWRRYCSMFNCSMRICMTKTQRTEMNTCAPWLLIPKSISFSHWRVCIVACGESLQFVLRRRHHWDQCSMIYLPSKSLLIPENAEHVPSAIFSASFFLTHAFLAQPTRVQIIISIHTLLKMLKWWNEQSAASNWWMGAR